MSHELNLEEQVFQLTRDQVNEELRKRYLPTNGIWHVCRVRLIKALRQERETARMADPISPARSIPQIHITGDPSNPSPDIAAVAPAERDMTEPGTHTANLSIPRDDTRVAPRVPPRTRESELSLVSEHLTATDLSRESAVEPARRSPRETCIAPRAERRVHFRETPTEAQTFSSHREGIETLCRDFERLPIDAHSQQARYRYENPRNYEIGYRTGVPSVEYGYDYREYREHYDRCRDDERAFGNRQFRPIDPARERYYDPSPDNVFEPRYRRAERDRREYEPREREFPPRAMTSSPRGAAFPVTPRYERTPANAAYDVMRRWNLKFSGKPGEDCNSFVARIEEGRNLVPISDADLLCCLPFFFSGIALYWFRSRRAEWLSWYDFERAFRIRFGEADLQQSLRDELSRRTQGEYEPVADYITCMRAMAERLSPPMSQYELLALAHRNMLPRLQVTIHRDSVYNLDHLESLVTRIERSYRAARSFRPPPAPEQSLMPDLAYHGPRNRNPKAAVATVHETAADDALFAFTEPLPDEPVNVTHEKPLKAKKLPLKSSSNLPPVSNHKVDNSHATGAPARNNTAAACTNPFLQGENFNQMHVPTSAPPLPPRTAVSPRPPPRCWNCNTTGHTYRLCTQQLSIFCYGCGRKSVTRSTCPKCSGNPEGGR